MSHSDITAIRGLHYLSGEPVTVTMTSGKISGIHKEEGPQAGDENLPWLAPGFVDLQINGFRGLDFNTIPIAKGTAKSVTSALFEEGVTSYYPTVITNGDDAIEQALRSIAGECREDAATAAGVAGIHLEGPFISPEDGPRGAHGRSFTKAPDWELFLRWQEAAEGRIKLITLSPEWPGTAGFVARCVEHGVQVSIGHTSATDEQIMEAAAAGARLSTHLGNGAHLMLPRHPNYIWAQLAQEELWTCVIGDGFHLPDSVLKVVRRVKGKRAILVSDAVAFSGLAPGTYESHIGGRVVLTPEGKLHLEQSPGILAGSAQMLQSGISHLVYKGIASLSEACDMASVHPAAFMGLPAAAGLAIGAPADLVAFEWTGSRLKLMQTYKHGNRVYTRAGTDC
ncbi:N-acetylglucosamine-6-phosphate deacetylase [Paenibacillus nasutitermitis]|uniref:N-acetylglucosamine-6-phosphate deacetylase n=1 Tax=Paenibacillus nasutitermitis TaxID=1652958 RepID=A0A916ZG74_9BACL|nr:amidohydrolase family protein [Paenibacillus nasutitermitis]GGD95737.1 N-acetylglucosamine-6-phosphate deacetylase [Paenibacillus nasutitermitis]